MNRTEKRKIEKQFGITSYVKGLNRLQRFERIRQNIIEGKKKQTEMKDLIDRQKEEKNSDVENGKISSLVTDLMIKENMSYIDALEKAKTLVSK